ncbi:unnamed protein product, partial [Nesidiocoris tenuis]
TSVNDFPGPCERIQEATPKVGADPAQHITIFEAPIRMSTGAIAHFISSVNALPRPVLGRQSPQGGARGGEVARPRGRRSRYGGPELQTVGGGRHRQVCGDGGANPDVDVGLKNVNGGRETWSRPRETMRRPRMVEGHVMPHNDFTTSTAASHLLPLFTAFPGSPNCSGSTVSELHDLLSGRHHWQATSHARPTYCNICRDALSGREVLEKIQTTAEPSASVRFNCFGATFRLPTQEHLKMRANSLKRAVRQLIEHSERVVDEQQNMARASEAVKGISGPTPDQLDIIDKRELMSISPLPPFRRDSNCSTGDMFMGNLPVPTEFADSRRPSASKITASSTLAPEEFSSEKIEVTADVEKRKNDAETPDDDLGMTIGRHVHDDDDEVCAAVDEGILSGLQLKDELANIGHIDSSETSDDSPEGTTELAKRELKTFRVNSKRLRQSIKFKTGSFENIDATNLISTSPDEDDDYDELLVLDNPINKRCSIAHFIEGSDIARRSIKCRHRKQTSMDDLDLEAVTVDTKDIFRNIPVIQVSSESDPTDDRCAPNRQSIRRAVKSDRLDVIQVTIQGSNNNLRGSTDGMFLSEYHHDTVHRKSLALSETDDEELVRHHCEW